ncbi:MAG: thioether cross-link-forming SCIFF peptide maturase [Clostridia bacterium]|nr:thioether cross-link-forming SCIFF peptide maturase [Clostridia bacterium]
MVHTFSINNKYIVYDSESGNVFEADKLMSALLCGGDLSKFSAQDILQAKKEIDRLKEQGLLYVKPSEVVPPSFDGCIKSLCVHICHDCNMNCKYCFGDGGNYFGIKESMSADTAFAAVDFLIEKSGSIKNLEMDFFGGEPLLNYPTIVSTVSYARQREKESGKKFKFTVTTNGLLLSDSAISFFNKEMDNVVISIDGRKQTHDNIRKTSGGKGTYDTVIKNAKKFRSKRGDKDYYIRGTYTAENLDFCSDVLALADCGFDQVSIEPVVLEQSNPLAIKTEHLQKIYSQYQELATKYIERRKSGKWFNFFHFMIDLDNAPCLKKRLSGCGAGGNYLAVAPDGGLYPCHQFVGKKEYLMGNVFEKSVSGKISEKFTNSNLLTKQKCSDCFAKYFCSGGCAAHNINYGGGINSPNDIYCEIIKKRFECALYIYAEEKAAD